MSAAATNRLAGETSPYLLQHAKNPVDWYPWGPEALERAKQEGKPIFLSIGYSACHWCHVMEHECFENGAIAALMNDHFINIKVDREERPDLDQVYMTAVQALTGQGGWPMSVFLTPDRRPFFGGTYFPPSDSRGMPGFPRVLLSVKRAWDERHDEIVASAAELTNRLLSIGTIEPSSEPLGFDLLDHAAKQLLLAFDPRNGGFGPAPKFLHTMDLRLLLRHHARTHSPEALAAVRTTLDKMAGGGIHDHLGGGFARYSTDERWLVPHFEKMLYDNALLASTYLEAYQVSRSESDAETARSILDYVLSRMTDSSTGAFYSAEDADSEGVEGKFYTWNVAELREVLGEERARTLGYVYDVNDRGNWEGQSILNLPRSVGQSAKDLNRTEADLRVELGESRRILLEAREQRIPPFKDTKVLTSWNGLMIAALAEAGSILKDRRYTNAAEKAAGFFAETMRTPDTPLFRVYREGVAKIPGFLDDYSHLIDGLTRLYEATGSARWIAFAIDLAETMIAEFSDPHAPGFHYTASRHEELISRQKDVFDNAQPSGNGMAATALLRLGALTLRSDLTKAAVEILQSMRTLMEHASGAAGQSLIALDFYLSKSVELALIASGGGSSLQTAVEVVAQPYLPRKVVAPATADGLVELSHLVGLLRNRVANSGEITTYICEGQTCRPAIVGIDGLAAALKEFSSIR